MLLEDSSEECQKDEFVALKSMYGDDLKNYPKKVPWRNWCPLNLKIALTPTKEDHRPNQEVHVQLVLHIECCEEYPKKSPTINLENVQGLSDNARETLQTELEQKAKEYEGDVMIYLLAIHVQEFLLLYNKPANKKSCFDEMVDAQARKMQQENEAKRQEEDRKRQEILQEIKELNENESEESEENISDEFEAMALESTNLRKFETINYDESKCNHGSKLIKFFNKGGREIHRGKCFEHRCSENCISYIAVDKKTFQVVFLTEWSINVQKNDVSRVKSEINRIKKELSALIALDHMNLCKYVDVQSDYSKDKQKYSVFLIQEFIQGATLTSIFFRNFVSCSLPLLQSIASGLLQALEYLHSNDVTCKELDPRQIYIDYKGCLKICTYSLSAQFDSLLSENCYENSNYTKQNDLLNCGKLLLALATGDKYSEEIPRTFPTTLQDFLHTCFGTEGAENNNATALLKHPFITCNNIAQHELLFEHHSDPDNNIEPPFQQPFQADMLQSSYSMQLQMIELIGEGAFGKVIKVRNTIDKNFYALKKIKFKPQDQKLMQEVSLLSALNHENVVRYFTSWIEDDNGSTLAEDGEVDEGDDVSNNAENSLQKLEEDIAKLTPGLQIEFSEIDEDNYDSSENDLDIYEGEDSSNYDSSSDAITFEENAASNNIKVDSAMSKMARKLPPEYKVLCIQMEFCEKSTLRSAIDDNLYLNKDRVWRLFRETVDGLMYIHQQKLIHRDLKPANIFLDSKDHVKIGDFGLATTTLITSTKQKEINVGSNEILPVNESGNQSGTGTDLSMTGHVGTSYYIAPEIVNKGKTKYNEKVDVYSLGVIFFEMCYRPINTGMERAIILKDLRHKNIKIPDDFEEKPKQLIYAQKQVIRLLLKHDPVERPTCEQLLQSEHVPPPVGAEAQRQQLIDQLFTHTKSKEYKYLLTSCFKPRAGISVGAQSVWYALPSNHRTDDAPFLERWLLILDGINIELAKIFKLHGYFNLATPLLLPRNQYYDETSSCVKLMTQNGFIVSVPHDLRLPFAQYLSSNGLTNLRRFTIERVYRERKVCMPREYFECAYDIVASTKDYMNDVEIIGILGEIINQIPAVRKKKLILRLNHKLLIHAILLHFGIKEKDLTESTSKCLSFYDLKFRSKLLTQPDGWKIFIAIHNFVQKEYPIDKMTSSLQIITNGHTIAAQYASKALAELRQIIEFAKYFEVPFEMVVSLKFLNNVHQYSGMMCQLSYEYKKKWKRYTEVLAEGGRYDNLVSEHRLNFVQQQQCQNQYAVGMTVLVEQLAKLTQKFYNITTPDDNLSYLDVVVCTLGSSTLTHVRIEVFRRLLAAKIRSRIIEVTDILDINNICARLNVHYAIIIKDSAQAVTVHSVDHDIRDKKVSITELVDYMISEMRGSGKEELTEQFSLSAVKTESKNSFSMDKNESPELNIDINFIDDKRNYKKRLESQIRLQVKTLLTGKIVIISLPIDRKEWNNIYPLFNLEPDKNLDDYMIVSTCKNVNKLRKEITRLRNKNMPMIIVHASRDSSYHVLV